VENSMRAGGRSADPIREDGRGHSERKPAESIVDRLGTLMAVVTMAALASVAIVAAHARGGQRVLEAFVVIVLASLPGWLFIRFMAFRAGSLWTEYVLNLHRLGMDDHKNLPRPPRASEYDVLWRAGAEDGLGSSESIYQQKFEAYYGQAVGPDAPANNPFSLKTLPPVLLATAVLAAGWSTVLARHPLFSGPLQLPVDSLRFGFMGAYVFIVQMLIRRFFQSDLKPSAYFAAVARVATVLVVVLVVHQSAPVVASFSPGVEVGTAFLIGFFPLLGMQILQKVVSTAFRKFVPTLKTPYPLSDLDGLNIWYEARLLEEGIEDLQNLVTGNLVDIILHTRVPVERLVDWIDQAALQLLVDPPTENKKDKNDVNNNKRWHTDRIALRRLGVRTATDLETMFLPAERLARRAPGMPLAGSGDGAFLEGMRNVLNGSSTNGPSVTEALLRNFSNIPNLVHVRHWRDILCAEHNPPTSGALALARPDQPMSPAPAGAAVPAQRPVPALA